MVIVTLTSAATALRAFCFNYSGQRVVARLRQDVHRAIIRQEARHTSSSTPKLTFPSYHPLFSPSPLFTLPNRQPLRRPSLSPSALNPFFTPVRTNVTLAGRLLRCNTHRRPDEPAGIRHRGPRPAKARPALALPRPAKAGVPSHCPRRFWRRAPTRSGPRLSLSVAAAADADADADSAVALLRRMQCRSSKTRPRRTSRC
jgi:hypothetical protein